MESLVFDYQACRDSEHFSIKRYVNAIYFGELIDQKREGLGIMIYGADKGWVYEGQWAHDKRNGLGYERYKNGNKYEGEFKDNKAHGKGVYSWVNGEIFDG